MTDLLNACPACGRQSGSCAHATQGSVAADQRSAKVTIQITANVSLVPDMKVFYAKAMQGNVMAAAEHGPTMAFLASVWKQIENAASYEQTKAEQTCA